MHTIIPKLRTKSAEEASEYIIKRWSENGFCIVNYLYGANIIARKLFENTTNNKYYQALKTCDILLPDGIALQIFAWFYFWKFEKRKVRLPNLNGTDFLGYLLKKLNKKYDLKLVLYGTRAEIIQKNAKFLEKQGYNVIYYQDGYREFDRNKFEINKAKDLKNRNSKNDKYHFKKTLYLLIQGRTTLRNPIQELRTQENIDKIKEHNFIVCNQSGTFDYEERGGPIKRAPQRVKKIKCERLRRTIINPKKGIGKVWVTLGLFELILSKIILQTTKKKINEIKNHQEKNK